MGTEDDLSLDKALVKALLNSPEFSEIVTKAVNEKIESMNLDTYFYTRSEAAEILRITLPTIDRLIRTGKLKAVKVGNSVRITQKVINDFPNVSPSPVSPKYL